MTDKESLTVKYKACTNNKKKMITVTEKQTREISRKFPKEKITRAQIYFLKVKPHY